MKGASLKHIEILTKLIIQRPGKDQYDNRSGDGYGAAEMAFIMAMMIIMAMMMTVTIQMYRSFSHWASLRVSQTSPIQPGACFIVYTS